MQKVSGRGIAFAEFNDPVVKCDLAAGEKIMVAMDASVSLDIKRVEGMKNVMHGGEGLFQRKFLSGTKSIEIKRLIRMLAAALS